MSRYRGKHYVRVNNGLAMRRATRANLSSSCRFRRLEYIYIYIYWKYFVVVLLSNFSYLLNFPINNTSQYLIRNFRVDGVVARSSIFRIQPKVSIINRSSNIFFFKLFDRSKFFSRRFSALRFIDRVVKKKKKSRI